MSSPTVDGVWTAFRATTKPAWAAYCDAIATAEEAYDVATAPAVAAREAALKTAGGDAC